MAKPKAKSSQPAAAPPPVIDAAAFLAATTQSSNDAVISFALDGRISSWNRGAERLFGYSAAEAVGKSGALIFPSDRLQEFDQDLTAAKLGKQIGNHETLRKRKDGLAIDVIVGVFPIWDETGNVVGLAAVIRDITECGSATADLAESEARFRSLVENASDVIFELDQAGRVTYISPSSRHFEAEPADVIGRPFADFIPPEDRPSLAAKFAKTAATGEGTPTEIRVINPRTGKIFWFEEVAHPRRDAAGRILGFSGALRDISERVEAQEALAESESRYRTFVNQSPDIIVAYGADGIVTYVSPQVEQYGYHAADIVGRRITDFIVPEQHAEAIRKHQISLDTGNPASTDYLMIEADGKRHWAEVRTQVIRDAQGRSTGIIGILRDISDRKRAEAVAAESQQRYVSIFENLAVGIYRNTAGPEGKFLEANPAMIRMFEADSKEEFMRHKVSDFYYDPAERLKFSQKLQEKGRLVREEMHFRTLKGRSLWCAITAVAKQDAAGQTYFDGLIEDVTALKEAQASAAEVSELRAQLLEHLTVGVYRRTLGPDAKIVESNPALLRILEAESLEELAKTKWSSIYERPEEFERFTDLLRRQKTVHREIMRYKTLRGRLFWAEISGGVRTTPDHQEYFDGIIRDVTAERESESALKRQLQAESLIASLSRDFINVPEKLFENAVRSAIEQVGRFIGADRALFFLLGADRLQIEQTQEWAASGQSTLDGAVIGRELLAVEWWLSQLLSGKMIVFSDPQDLPAEAVSGQNLFVSTGIKSAILAPVMGSGRTLGFLVFTVGREGRTWADGDRDMISLFSEVIGNAIGRSQAEHRVREADKLRNKFVQIVSHQLRTPLTSIRWNLEALLAGDLGQLGPGQKGLIKVVHDVEVEAIRRIGEMLTALDIEEGRIVLNKEEFSFESLWGSVLVALQRYALIRNITIQHVSPPESLPLVEADVEKVRAVLETLVENAVDYSHDGGRVETSIRRNGTAIRFEVKDSGVGIPEAEQPRIFSRFYRASNSPAMKPDASGLGLSIAKYYVEQHGGQIGFESKEDVGSTFWFELPVG